MHELSLAGSVLRIAEQAAQREGFVHVRRLVLEVGALAGVDVPALRFALQAVAPGTCLQGCAIDIEEPPGQAWCPACSQQVPLASRSEACPHCNHWPLQDVTGTALRVRELLVDDALQHRTPDSLNP